LVSLHQIQALKHKDSTKIFGPKILEKARCTPCFFKKKLGKKLFVEFLPFDSLDCLGGTKNDVYRRRLLISSTYRDKK